ncbi:MAG TPA: metallophosphoesterase family protein [Usitatibacter sp.]|nr:metallophosphoesterase family protein [Usitatibacter sp.]
MAIYGVLGDIHGNREALEAALAALDAMGVERLLCVGDLVGYNADPDACVAMLRERGAVSIAGNHDLIGTGRLGFERCSNKAMHSLRRTRRALAPATAEYLASLPSHHVVDGRILLTHGGVRDVQQYMTKPHHLRENAAYLHEDFPGLRVCFFGHTHEQKVFRVQGGDVTEPFAQAIGSGAPAVLAGDCDYFVNPGSVDASRKRAHKLCELAVLDSEALAVTFHRAPYDEAATEKRASEGGYRIERWRDRLYDVQRRLIGPRQVEHR